ncbi:MAG: YggS family pyridoxal phosphate-dependent enzyme [Rhizomicrobium sp.]|jgi:pyridoxal phosphate enzyme (YggS family)
MPSSPESNDPASVHALRDILNRIECARKAAVSPASQTTLIAVSKTFGPNHVRPVLQAGQRTFGENRVQEAKSKWPALRVEFPDVELHLIGPLQTNKVREAVELFDAIHSLDRPKLAHALKAELDRAGRSPLLFIQVNTGEEPQKAGVLPRDVASFVALCRDELGLPVRGLMCIPPSEQPPAVHFALLAKLSREHRLPLLSMGMSADFETAIRFGATHVRIGTAIFGARTHPDEGGVAGEGGPT